MGDDTNGVVIRRRKTRSETESAETSMEPRGQVNPQESAVDVGSVVEPSRVLGTGSQSKYGGTTMSRGEVAVEAAAANRPGDAELTFAEMLAEFDAVGRTSRRHRAGDVVTGRITSIGLESAFVHLGGKTEGVLDRAQITDSHGCLTVVVGTTVSARVVGEGHETGLIELALKVGEGPKAVEQLALAMSEGLAVEGRVSGINKGGFDVDVAGMRAFCPISQIDDRFVKDGQVYLGRTFDFAITQCEPGPRPNIVLSRRVLLDAERERLAEVTRGQLTVGAVVRGVVTAVQEFGVFVDLGGLEGLVHVSELSHVRVDDPKRFAEVGQQLDVVVLGIEASTDAKHARRVRLSCKALEPDPWAEAGFVAGQRVSGKVARIQSFGAFIEIAPGIEGLVHISEMGAGQRIKSPRDVVAEGQEVHVQILSIDPGRRRIALSIDAAQEQDREAEDRVNIASYQPSSGSLGTFADLLKK